jgi:hypothetical protein
MNYSTFRLLELGAKLCLIQKGEKKEPQVDKSFEIEELVHGFLNLQTL